MSVQIGAGYPPYRRESQQQSRQTLFTVSQVAHKSLAEIISGLPDIIVRPALEFPGVRELIDVATIESEALEATLLTRIR